jgi:hypothetical protein
MESNNSLYFALSSPTVFQNVVAFILNLVGVCSRANSLCPGLLLLL